MIQVVGFEIFLHKEGLFFPDDHFEYNNPVLSWKLNILSHISVYLNIICSMSTEAIYFAIQVFILVALNDNLECTVFYVDLETSSKIKLIWVPTQYYMSIPLSCLELCFF